MALSGQVKEILDTFHSSIVTLENSNYGQQREAQYNKGVELKLRTHQAIMKAFSEEMERLSEEKKNS